MLHCTLSRQSLFEILVCGLLLCGCILLFIVSPNIAYDRLARKLLVVGEGTTGIKKKNKQFQTFPLHSWLCSS